MWVPHLLTTVNHYLGLLAKLHLLSFTATHCKGYAWAGHAPCNTQTTNTPRLKSRPKPPYIRSHKNKHHFLIGTAEDFFPSGHTVLFWLHSCIMGSRMFLLLVLLQLIFIERSQGTEYFITMRYYR